MTGHQPKKLVAHILPFPGVGGTEHATLRVIRAVEASGYSGLIVLLHEIPALRKFFEDAGCEVLAWSVPEPSVRRPRKFLRQVYGLAQELKARGVDLIHCADYLAAWYTALIGPLMGVPLICHIRNRLPEVDRRARLFLWPVKQYVFVSQDTWDNFPIRVPSSSGRVLYDGIRVQDCAEFHDASRSVKEEFGLPESAQLIGMLARVAPQKDYDTLILAAKQVTAACPDAYFIIAGDHSFNASTQKHYARVQNLLQEAGLTQRFIFAGYRSDTPRLIAAFDVSVLSTHAEGLPLVLLETMAQGKVTVATAVDGVPEVIEDGRTGFLVRHQDADALASRLIDLLKSPDLAHHLGVAGQAMVRQRFSLDQFALSLVDLYDQATGSSRSAGTPRPSPALY